MGNKQSSGRSGKKRKYAIPPNAVPPSQPGRPKIIHCEDDAVYLEWAEPKLHGGCPIIGYSLESRTLDSYTWINSGMILENSPCCWLRNLIIGDVYIFRVLAESIIGFSQPSEESDPALISLDDIELGLVMGLEDTEVEEGRQLTMLIQATGSPLPHYRWYLNNLELIQDLNQDLIISGAKITFRKVQKRHAGTLKCVAQNGFSQIDSSCTVVIGIPPKIIQDEELHYFSRVGEMVRIKVRVEAVPEPQVSWYHDGLRVETATRSLHLGSWAVLKLDSAIRSARGEYTLVVQNKYGRDEASVLVTIADRPGKMSRKPRVRLVKNAECIVEWDGDVDDGGCEVKQWQVEYWRVGWDVWLTAAATRTTSAKIYDLIPGSRYVFRVRAENAYGIGEPSDVSEELQVPEDRASVGNSFLMGTLIEEPSTIHEEEPDELVPSNKSKWATNTIQEKPSFTERSGRLSPNFGSSRARTILDEEEPSVPSTTLKADSFSSNNRAYSPNRSRIIIDPPAEAEPKTEWSDPYSESTRERKEPSPIRRKESSPIRVAGGSSMDNAATWKSQKGSLMDSFHLQPSGKSRERLEVVDPRMRGSSPSRRTSSPVLDFYFEPTANRKMSLLKTEQGKFPTDYVRSEYEDEEKEEESDSEEPIVEVTSSLTFTKHGSCAIRTSRERLDSSRSTSRASLIGGNSREQLHSRSSSSGELLGSKLHEEEEEKEWLHGSNKEKKQESVKTEEPGTKMESEPESLPERLLLNWVAVLVFLLSLGIKYVNLGIASTIALYVLYRLFTL